jgi:O-antigen ligase
MKTALRWTVLGALFIIPFLPLFVANGLFFPFITGKGFAFRILVELAAGAYILLALADKKYRPRFSWTLLIYGAFTLWMLIADLLAVNPHKALWSNYERMDGWVTMIHVFLFFVIAGAVLSADKLWKRWWQAALVGSVIVSAYGLGQMIGMFQIHQGGVRADASFGNAIYLAVYLMFMIGIALWQAIETRKVWLRYGLIALAAAELVIVFATATRGVILGIFAAAALVALMVALRSPGKLRKAGIGGLIALVAVAGLFFLARDSAFVRSEPTLTRIATVFDSSELAVRSTLWGMAYQGFLARPITGWGQEGYNYVFNTYYHPSLYGQEAWFDRAHNTYLDWLVAGGAPALLLFLALLIVGTLALFRSNLPRAEKLALLGILAAYAIQAVSAFDNLFSYILLAAILAMAHDLSARPIKSLAEVKEVTGPAFSAMAVPAVFVVTLVALWFVNVPSIQAAGDLITAASTSDPAAGLARMQTAAARGSFATQEIAEQAVTFAGNVVTQTSLPAALRQQTFSFAADRITAALKQAPRDARLILMYGQLLGAAGDHADSLTEVSTAISLSPKKQALYFQRGIQEWQGGDAAAAAKDFATAYDLDHSFQLAASYDAAGKMITGDVPGADALLVQTYGTTTIDSDILRYAYYDLKLYGRLVDSAKAGVIANPDNVQAHFLLIQAYIIAGRIAEAKADLAATLAAHPDAATAAQSLTQQLGQ